MAANRPGSSQNQSTLFQTWGYSGNEKPKPPGKLQNDKLKRKKNKLPPLSKTIKGKINVGFNGVKEHTREHGQESSKQNTGDDLDDILECLENDNDEDLCAAITDEEPTRNTYLCKNFNPNISPESLPGFDSSAGHNYIYPINYPVRDYQFDIIMKALTENTLVVLPTGLGKTFIAAVVMYNFYRWYPQGKVLFMAPTKPLVAQQIQACYSITGTPAEDTAEMTGSMTPDRRKVLWETKRMFFITPHVLQNDLGRGNCFAKDIVCLVFDEAHKALGNYAYCQVIKEVAGCKSNFRVLALSATPGEGIDGVQQVITNLMISHVELRSEDSIDIKPYVFGRNVEKIVVPLSDELKKAKSQFLQVLEGIIGRLCSQGVCWQHDATKISKFFLLKARDQFRDRGMEDKNRIGMIEGDFALAISLYHAYELLQQHGILSFYNFLKEICSGKKGTARGRYELMRHEKFMEMMEDLQNRIEPPDDADGSLNSSRLDTLTPKRRLLKSIPKPNSLFSSHPKLKKLEEIVVKHFETAKENLSSTASQGTLSTRIMIFSQYRDSVQEITAVLNKHQPLVKVMSFVGQGGSGKGKRGLSQKEQLEVLENFRKGGYNVLVSTSVGEEGLDIGEVDLIICFDASNSPIRLVQRMGRTGRKRAGKIVILVTEGKEDQVYKRSLTNKKSIHKKLLDATNSLVLYDENPRMIPKHLNPYCLKIQITVKAKETTSRGVKRKSTDRKSNRISRNSLDKFTVVVDKNARSDGLLNAEEEDYWREHFRIENADLEGDNPMNTTKLSLSEWLPWQNIPQTVHFATHSKKTYAFCELIEFSEMAIAEVDGESFERDLEPYLEDNEFLRPEKAKDKKRNSKESNKRNKYLKEKNDETVKISAKSREGKLKGKGKVERGKAWRQGTLRVNQEEFSDDDDEDFQIKKITCNAGLSENEKERVVIIEKFARKVSSKSAVRIEAVCPATCHQVEEEDNCYNKVNDMKDESLPESEDNQLQDAIPITAKPAIDLNAFSSKLKRFQRQNSNEDKQLSPDNQIKTGSPIIEENDDIFTQNISAYLPSSTPNRTFAAPRTRSSGWKFRRRIAEAAVPAPPTFSDLSCLSLGDIAEDDDFIKGDDESNKDRFKMAVNFKEKSNAANVPNKSDMDAIIPNPPALSILNMSLDNIVGDSPPIVEGVDNFRSCENVLEHRNVDSERCGGKHGTEARTSAEKDNDEKAVSVTDLRRHERTVKEVKHNENVVRRLAESSELSVPNCSSRCFGKPQMLDNENLPNEFPVKDSDFTENAISFKSVDISSFDLFGDSLMMNGDDDLGDFDDCPSPPVVAQTRVSDVERKQHVSGGSGTVTNNSNHLDRVEISSPGHKVKDFKQANKFSQKELEALSASSAERDQINMASKKDIAHPVSNDEEKQQLDTETKFCLDAYNFDDEESINFPGDFNMLSETEEDSQPPMQSLASRLRNRGVEGVDEVAEKTRGKERTEHLLGDTAGFKHPSGVRADTKQSFQANSEETRRRLPLSRNKSNGGSKPSVRVPPWPRTAICNSDDESPMPSLASRLKDRKSTNGSCVVKQGDDIGCQSTISERFRDGQEKTSMPVKTVRHNGYTTLGAETLDTKSKSPSAEKACLDLSRANKTPKSSKHVTFSSNTNIQPLTKNDNNVDRNIVAKKTDFVSPLRNTTANKDNFLSPGESPIITNRRRKRKPIGILSDDSRSSSCENDVVNKDSDEDSEDLALQRKKTSKVRLLATPTIQRGNESSDDDFDCGTSSKKAGKQRNGNTRIRAKKNIEGRSRQQKRLKSNFIDDEAEVTGDESGDDYDHAHQDEYVMDSFIDDASQGTYRTPKRDRRGNRESPNMAMIYRQSLFSPLCGALNFRTPIYRTDRYKMTGRQAWHHSNDSEDDEAEEVNGLIDDDGDFDEESESVENSLGDVTMDDSQDTTNQSKAMHTTYKRKSRIKRIIDSDDEHDCSDDFKDDDHSNNNNHEPRTNAKRTASSSSDEVDNIRMHNASRRNTAKRINDSDDYTSDCRDRSKSDLIKKGNGLSDRADDIDLQNSKRRITKNRINDSDDHNVSVEDLIRDDNDQNLPKSNGRLNTPGANRGETIAASNLAACNRGLLEKKTTVNCATTNFPSIAKDISSVNGIKVKPFGEKARNVIDKTINQFNNKPEKRIPMQNERTSGASDDDLDESFCSESDDDIFIPCFDLGLDIGPIDSEMIANAWKNNAHQQKSCQAKGPPQNLARPSSNAGTILQGKDLHVFAHSRAVSSSQVGSALRLKFRVNVTVCANLGCDFVVSKRMGVLRKVVSDISNGSHSGRNLEAIKEMCEHYSKACVIIEKDRVKGSSTNERPVSYTKYYAGLLGHLAECKIKVLFSDSQDETALLISKLAEKESATDFRLDVKSTKLLNNNLEQMLKVLLTIPYLAYPIALCITNEFKYLKAVIKSSPEEIRARVPQISTKCAKALMLYFRHKVCTV